MGATLKQLSRVGIRHLYFAISGGSEKQFLWKPQCFGIGTTICAQIGEKAIAFLKMSLFKSNCLMMESWICYVFDPAAAAAGIEEGLFSKTTRVFVFENGH